MAKKPYKKWKPIDAFEAWFKKYPGVLNPFDLNTKEKYDFLLDFIESHGSDGIRYAAELLKCRKSTKSDPRPWTQYDYWKEQYPEKPNVPSTTCDHDDVKGLELYREWFKLHSQIDNPVDINMRIKADFMERIGWKSAVIMHKSRKRNTKANGYPCPWTKLDFDWAALERKEANE
jgi:hypothetical protein